MMTKIQSNPQKHFCTVGRGSAEIHLSLWYIRQIALKTLGKPAIEEIPINQNNTRYHATIPWVKFNISRDAQKADKWQEGSACNSETSAKALGNYFLHLRDACGIKKGKKKFEWNTQELRFVEIE